MTDSKAPTQEKESKDKLPKIVTSKESPSKESTTEISKSGSKSTKILPNRPENQVCSKCGSEIQPRLKTTSKASTAFVRHQYIHGKRIEPTKIPDAILEMIEESDWIFYTCMVCEEEKEKENKKRSVELWNRDNIETLLRRSRIKKKFLRSSFGNFHTDEAELRKKEYSSKDCRNMIKVRKTVYDWADSFTDNLENGNSLTFLGNPGTGKNHLACAAMDHIIRKFQKSCVFISASRFFMEVKNIYAKKESELEYLDVMCRVDLLVINEIGIQLDTDWEWEKMNWLINERIDDVKPFIMISNLGWDEITALLGDRMTDRIAGEGNRILNFNWPSYR